MKRILIALFVVFNSINVFSQKVVLDLKRNIDFDFSKQYIEIDTMLMEVEYDYKYNEAPQYDDFLRNDILYLEIGNKMTHSYSVFEKKMDEEIEAKYQTRGKRGHFSFDSRIGEIYSNYPEGEITVLTGMDCAGVFRHREVIPDFAWRIGDEHKQVLDYDCVKATCSFRGRDYEAWFAPSIPMSYGPWKFCGLPGLILEIYDSKKEYIFECKGIQKVNQRQITFWNRKYKDCTRKEMRKYQNMLHKKPADFIAQYGIKVFNVIQGPVTNENWGYDRNVIEKE